MRRSRKSNTVVPLVPSSGACELIFARSPEELSMVDHIWREVYGRELGWLDREGTGLYRDQFHEHSEYLLCLVGDRPAATMRLVRNSYVGLPVEMFVAMDDELEGREASIECTRLMVLPEFRDERFEGFPFGLFPAMIKATVQFCLREQITHIFADLFLDTPTTPRRQLALLGFEETGLEFVDHELEEPSVSTALVLKVADLVAQIFREGTSFHQYIVSADPCFRVDWERGEQRESKQEAS